MDRKSEIRQLMAFSPEEVREKAGDRLIVLPDIDALHRRMAEDIADEIAAADGASLRLILPVGPTGYFPLLPHLIESRGLSLANCWLFFMDEYCGEDGKAVPASHPLSFKGIAQRDFLDHLPASGNLDPAKVVFPDEKNIDALSLKIEQLGGINACFGGIGIHGHVAFNEPERGVSESPARKVRLNDYTVTINAIRSQVGGDLENFPRYAFTLGMKEILSAERIRLYCRNGIDLDWANTILRLALFGEPGDDYPVTHIRDKDYVIVTDEDTLRSPQNRL